tara:strand:- start:1375 stop:1509 length:135 start_codon:yes stop_codon:yes gene_type:complete
MKGKSKKTGVVMVISVGGKPPKKPEKTADTKKGEAMNIAFNVLK